MRPELARFFIKAVLEESTDIIFHSNEPGTPDVVITLYSEDEETNVHSDVYLANYQAIARIAKETANLTGENKARAIYNAVKSQHNLDVYFGVYLTGAMSSSTDPVTFTPDDGSGNTKVAAFNVGDYILIDDEILKVTTVGGSTIIASRAELGTTKAAHSDNDIVYNITKCPVPGMRCMSTKATSDIMDLGLDEKQRRSFALNWTVRLKIS